MSLVPFILIWIRYKKPLNAYVWLYVISQYEHHRLVCSLQSCVYTASKTCKSDKDNYKCSTIITNSQRACITYVVSFLASRFNEVCVKEITMSISKCLYEHDVCVSVFHFFVWVKSNCMLLDKSIEEKRLETKLCVI